MAKPSKFDAAVNKSRGIVDEDVISSDDVATMQSLTTIPTHEGGQSIATFDPSYLQALIESGQLEAAPQLFSLEAGQMITGIVDSCGTAELIDQNTKQPKPVRTWQLTLVNPDTGAKGRTISILGAAMLDRQLEGGNKESPKWIGEKVIIARGETKKGGKGNLTDYFVGRFVAKATAKAPSSIVEAG